MFERNKQSNNPSQVGGISTPGQQSPPHTYDVYTLPDKFLPATKVKKTRKKSGNKTLYVLLGLMLVVLLAGGGVWYYFRYMNDADSDTGPTTNIAPLDVTDTEPEEEIPVEIPSIPPQPIVYVAKDITGQVVGIMTIQLSAADSELVTQIKVASSDASDNPRVIGDYYRITPSGLTLNNDAEIKIEYFDENLTSSVENSLRIGFEESLSRWTLSEDSEVDLSKNEITLEIKQIPRNRVAIVSNLTTAEIELEKGEEEVFDFDQENLIASVDTDNDRLTDVEELMYGTDFTLPDSDGDGYIDGEEIFNLYSPRDVGLNLIDSGIFQEYQNPVFDYKIIYPATWTANSIDDQDKIIIFSSPTSQFVEIVIEELDPDITEIMDWYAEQVPGLVVADVRAVEIGKSKIPAIMSLDGKTIYFIHNNSVVAFSYNLGIESQADYLTTWEAMKNSWVDLTTVITESTPEPAPEENGETNPVPPEATPPILP